MDIIRIQENTDQENISVIKLNQDSIRITNQLDVTLESLSDVIGSTTGPNSLVFIYIKHLQTFVTVQNNKINFIKHSLTQASFNKNISYVTKPTVDDGPKLVHLSQIIESTKAKTQSTDDSWS